MKHSELLWIQNMARLACGKTTPANQPTETLTQSFNFFLEELTSILQAYVNYFNDLVIQEQPELTIRIFKLGTPRSGIMLLRGKEKLVLQNDGFRLRVRVVQIRAYQEQNVDAFDVDPFSNSEGMVSWVTSHDRQRVNPQLLAQEYLGRFMTFGATAFVNNRAHSARSTASLAQESAANTP